MEKAQELGDLEQVRMRELGPCLFLCSLTSVLSFLTQPAGYYGPGCVDACLLNPCQNQGSCRRLQGAPHGYTCDCASGYFGQHCEHR